MRGRGTVAVWCLVTSCLPAASAQTRRQAAQPRMVTEPADLMCPAVLGRGAASGLAFCDIRTGRDPASGAIVKIPPHRGQATLIFDLHNRHTYSEEEVRAKRGYAMYTATIGVLTLDNTLVSRAVAQTEFRTSADLLDRIGGGADGGMKAVAPLGRERIVMALPEGAEAVSILGEKLEVLRIDGPLTYSSAGREIALVSNVMLEYTPAPQRK